MKFVTAGLAEKDGQWFALGTYDGRFMQLPITEEEAKDIQPHLNGDRTYSISVEQDRVVREGELIVTAPAGAAQPA
jgi:hypothetical protein